MHRLANRLEKLERAAPKHALIVHAAPGQSAADAIAAHKRAHGPIPSDVSVIVIHHSFTSAL